MEEIQKIHYENEIGEPPSGPGTSGPQDGTPQKPVGGSQVKLNLGDIIQLIAPTHEKIHQQTFIIEYLDESQITLLDVANLTTIQLNLDAEGYLIDESVQKIYILSRSEEEGYARQNDLLPKTWIDIYIGGETPVIITGKITNLDEDMIEVTTYPEMDVIYIDFEYKGIPRSVPFERFEIREKPAGLLGTQFDVLRTSNNEGRSPELFDKSLSKSLSESSDESKGTEPPLDENANSEDFVANMVATIDPDDANLPDKNMFDALNSLYLAADDIVFGEELEEIDQLVELPENQRRYGVEVQANDIMDEMLSTVPNSRRTKEIMDRIHQLIERYKQLRTMFSKFDQNGNVSGFLQLGPLHKPLVEHIRKLDVTESIAKDER